jgi:hypothetical protein
MIRFTMEPRVPELGETEEGAMPEDEASEFVVAARVVDDRPEELEADVLLTVEIVLADEELVVAIWADEDDAVDDCAATLEAAVIVKAPDMV